MSCIHYLLFSFFHGQELKKELHGTVRVSYLTKGSRSARKKVVSELSCSQNLCLQHSGVAPRVASLNLKATWLSLQLAATACSVM